MFNYIKGNISLINPKFIVVEVNNIGYEVIVTNPYNYNEGSEVKLFIKEIIKEDSFTLYGFDSLEVKEMFELLLEVNGVGPKTALSILASSDILSIKEAIKNKNQKFLEKFPKIGPKVSAQIILDLGSKIKYSHQSIKNSKLDDLTLTLEALGYLKKDINYIINKLNYDEDISNLVKNALKLLNK